MAHYELRPFAVAEAETVAGWAGSEQERHSLDGEWEPLRAADVALWSLETTGSFTLRRDGDLVAYGEIVEDEVVQDVEIQHLLVAPDVRHTGVGRAMLAHLCVLLEESRPFREVWLRTERSSPEMISCARAVQFADAPEMSGPRFLWLKKTLTPRV